MDIEKLTDVVGARVTGLDLSQELDDETHSTLHKAWLDHQVLVIPGQDFTQEEQIRFARRWGEFPKRERYKKRAEKSVADKSIMLVSNIRENGIPIGSLPDGEMMFHSDGAYAKRPFRYTLLYAIEIPSAGGNTKFANMYKAYEALPELLKDRLANAHAEQVYYAGSVEKNKPSDSLTGKRVHPLFIAHEETGRTALYASRLITTRIEGLPSDESDEILEQICEISEREEFVYEHAWTPGDLVMWDNRCTNHARTDFSPGERRLLRRTTVFGVDPVSANAEAA